MNAVAEQEGKSDAGLEARFIEQEHRFIKIVQNYFTNRARPAGDVRQTSARNALLWHIFSPATVAVAGGGIIAVASLVILSIQTGLIAQQNRYFQDQNKAIQDQIEQQASQERDRRRTEVIASIYALKDSPGGGAGIPSADARTRIEAFREFLTLERARVRALAPKGAATPRINLAQVEAGNLNLSQQDFRDVDMQGSNLEGTDFAGSNLQRADLRGSLFARTNFKNADLSGWNCEACNLNEAAFAGASLRHATLTSADIANVNFYRADLLGAELTGLRNSESAQWAYANIGKARGLSPQHRAALLAAGAVEFDTAEGYRAYIARRLVRP